METATFTVNRRALSKQIYISTSRMFLTLCMCHKYRGMEKYYLLRNLSDHYEKVFQIKRFEIGL